MMTNNLTKDEIKMEHSLDIEELIDSIKKLQKVLPSCIKKLDTLPRLPDKEDLNSVIIEFFGIITCSFCRLFYPFSEASRDHYLIEVTKYVTAYWSLRDINGEPPRDDLDND